MAELAFYYHWPLTELKSLTADEAKQWHTLLRGCIKDSEFVMGVAS